MNSIASPEKIETNIPSSNTERWVVLTALITASPQAIAP
jgi:hypothetical protein